MTALRVLQGVILLRFYGFASDDFLPPDATACACPGSSVQYSCTVNDPTGNLSSTVWRGTAFDCNAAVITLAHLAFSNTPQGECDNGNFTLTAQGLANVTDNCYTSVLTVNIEPGLNGRTVECTLAGGTVVGSDTLQVAEPLPPPSAPQVVVPVPDQSFTVSWGRLTPDCGSALTYVYPGLAASSICGQCGEGNDPPSVTCSGWTAQEQNCSYTVRGDTDNVLCGAQQGGESQPVVISFPRPTTPSITGGEVVFDQSRGNSTVTVEWGAVAPTAAIAESGGDVLLSGAIRDYLVTFISGDPVVVNCASATCTSSAARLTDGTNLFIRVAARNAITQGEAGQALCSNFQVVRSLVSSVLDVTLTCPVAGCTIRYGLDPTYQTLPSEGRSGEPLQNLTAGETYYTEATFTCGGLTVHVRDTFATCECPSSGLFAGVATEAATCPQEFTGGVRTSSSNGIACYSGLTADSTAVFMCDVCGAECTGVCEAVCVCPSGQTEGQWSGSFENAACVVRGTNLSSSITIAVVVTFLLTLLIGVPLGMLLMYCITWKMNTARTSSAEPHTEPATTTAAAAVAPVYDLVGPGPEKFEMEGNTAYGPVRR